MAVSDLAGWRRASDHARRLVARVRDAQAACSDSTSRATREYWLGKAEGRSFDLLDYIGRLERGECGEGAGDAC